MANFIGIYSSLDTQTRANDPNNRMRPNFHMLPDFRQVRPDDFALLDYFQTSWWPGNAGMADDAAGVYGNILQGCWYDQPEKISGQSTRWGITGIARDAYGSPLAGVEMILFKTDDDTKQDIQFSDANGVYLLTTPFYQAHYIVAYKTGSPDVTGATANTLIPGT